MANHRAQAQFDRAKWRLLVLLPVWVLQLLLATAMMGLFSWRLGDTIKHYDERDGKGQTPTIEFAWEATNIAMSCIVALCTFFEIVRFVSESLTPWTMLFTHVIKLTCAAAILALDVVVYVQRSDAHYSLIGIGLDAALIITALGLAIYAVLTYRRLSAYDDYARPVNVKGYGFNDGLDRDFSYSSRLSVDKRGSVASSRLSIGSMGNPFTASSYRGAAAAADDDEPVQLHTIERTPSFYSHERDTQFDDYVARRSSLGNSTLKADVERALSAELERGGGSPDAVIIGSGAVKTRSRGPSIGRATSYTSDHVLVAVPEEAETEHHATDRAALLGLNRRDSDQERSVERELDGPAVRQEVDITEPKWRREQ
ncbi:Centromere protein V [Purpureocillium lavendulum]|uniref:Centromere protein V n=1 Tax=Purpureocillium lavendulum TaxID=1247861 RepID=A0AB34FQ06_9HYPO|nr:Centromere protein V [Purpureocillium lavendulum]